MSIGTAGLTLAARLAPVRAAMRRLAPSPGAGPSQEVRRNGFFRIEVHTRTTTGDRYRCDVQGVGDPGYQATSVMLGESALVLLDDGVAGRTGSGGAAAGGVLTPATALGRPLVERLRTQGFVFSVTRLPG